MINKFKDFVWLLIGGIGLIILVFVCAKYIGAKQYKPEIPVGSKKEYVIYTQYKDRPIYITKLRAVKDTVYKDVIFANDSSHYQIIARADTLIYEDSSEIYVAYHFPPANYFAIQANLKEKIITKELTITKPYDPSFWDRWNVVIYGGIGYDFIERRPSLSVGVGFGIDIKKIF
jgi:hypothetical protein